MATQVVRTGFCAHTALNPRDATRGPLCGISSRWLLIAVLVSPNLGACTAAPDATSTSPPATSADAPASPAAPPNTRAGNGSATPAVKRPTAVRATATAQPPPSPTPLPSFFAVGPLHIDSSAGRIYARGPEQRTLVIDARTGRQLATLPMAGTLALDAERQRLFIDRRVVEPGLMAFDTRTLSMTWSVPLPVPGEETKSEARAEDVFGKPEIPPTLDQTTGRVYAYRASTIYEIDPSVGQVVRRLTDVLGDNPNDLRQALLSQDGRTLFATKIDVETEAYDYDMVLAAYDTTSGRERFRQAVIGHYIPLAIAGPRLLSVGRWGWEDKSSVYQWSADGLSARSEGWPAQVTAAVYDPVRHRVVASIHRFEERNLIAIFDEDTLDLQTILDAPVEGNVAGYDPVSDNLYFDHAGRVAIVPASTIAAAAAASSEPAVALTGTVASLVVSEAWPRDPTMFGVASLPNMNARCRSVWSDRAIVASLDGGLTWAGRQTGLPACDDQNLNRLALSPSFAEDSTLFAALRYLGMFRSDDAGRLWQSASAGLESMIVNEIIVSPAFARDGTVFAGTSPFDLRRDPDTAKLFVPQRTAWRSRDGGRSWQPIGAHAQLALSPAYEHDQTLYAFGFESDAIYRSHDAGERWELLSRLPEKAATDASLYPGAPTRVPGGLYAIDGGGSASSILFARMVPFNPRGWVEDMTGETFRSADGGRTWQVISAALPGVDQRLAPRNAAGGRSLVWAEHVWDEAIRRNRLVINRSDDLGLTWYPVSAPRGTSPWAINALPDGRIMAQDRNDGTISIHALEEFRRVGGEAGCSACD